VDTSGFRPPTGAAEPVRGSAWTDRDTALLWTCQAVRQIVSGERISARTPTPFALPHPSTRAHFRGPVRVFSWTTGGDGSYVHRSGFVGGTGVLGIALIAGSLTANAAGNARRRQQAEQNARPAWRHQFDADVYVTDAGFVLHDRTGLSMWPLSCLDVMQMLAPETVLVQGRAADGPFSWRLQTPWAELIFAMWALARHPDHTQLRDGTWLPPGWLAWAREQQRDPGVSTARVTRQRPELR
jgi:hypothetical protein